MRYDVVKLVHCGRLLLENTYTVEDVTPGALAEVDRGTVWVAVVRGHRRSGRWGLWVRVGGELRPFGRVRIAERPVGARYEAVVAALQGPAFDAWEDLFRALYQTDATYRKTVDGLRAARVQGAAFRTGK